jgi:hypothetical protein
MTNRVSFVILDGSHLGASLRTSSVRGRRNGVQRPVTEKLPPLPRPRFLLTL